MLEDIVSPTVGNGKRRFFSVFKSALNSFGDGGKNSSADVSAPITDSHARSPSAAANNAANANLSSSLPSHPTSASVDTSKPPSATTATPFNTSNSTNKPEKNEKNNTNNINIAACRGSVSAPLDSSANAKYNMFDAGYNAVKNNLTARRPTDSAQPNYDSTSVSANRASNFNRSTSQSGATTQLAADFFKLRTARMFQVLNTPQLAAIFESFLKSIFAGEYCLEGGD